MEEDTKTKLLDIEAKLQNVERENSVAFKCLLDLKSQAEKWNKLLVDNEELRKKLMEAELDELQRRRGIKDIQDREDEDWAMFRREEHRLQGLWVSVFNSALSGILANANSSFADFQSVINKARDFADAVLGKKRPPYDPMSSSGTATVTLPDGSDGTPPMDKE